MKINILHPIGLLSEYIKYYWIIDNNSSDHSELVYPDGNLQMLFHCKSPFIEMGKNGKTFQQPKVSVCGQRTEYSYIKSLYNSYSIGVVFYPYSFPVLFSFPVEEITNNKLNITDVFSDWYQHEEDFYNAINDRERIDIIERYFLTKIRINDEVKYKLAKSCIRRINASNGNISIGNICKSYNITGKYLQRLFRQYIGITPKKYSEFIKLNYTIEILKNPGKNLNIMHEYYDQSHLIRNLKKYTGLTPLELQDICKAQDVAFIQ